MLSLRRIVRSLECISRVFGNRSGIHTSDEQGISSEDGSVVAILKQIANAVLCMAWSMESLDLDVADVECLVVSGSLGDLVAVLAAYDWDRVRFELGTSQRDSSYGTKGLCTISALPPA